MDYPQLNLLFGLALIFTVVINIGLRILLSKVEPPVWLSLMSLIAVALSILSALYIEFIFLRLMTPAFNLQIGLGLLLITGIGAIVFASMYRRMSSARLVGILFGVQIFVSLVSWVLAFGLYRSLVPISPP